MPSAKTETGLDQFFTHPAHAAELVKWAHIPKDAAVLEPSAGCGYIAKHIDAAYLMCIERDSRLSKPEGLKCDWETRDFLKFKPTNRFDVAVMNPPYSDGQDRMHIEHALEHCADRVVCLVRVNMLAGLRSYRSIFSKYRLRRICHLTKRPMFAGPDTKNFGARSDYVFLDIVSSHPASDIAVGTLSVTSNAVFVEWLKLPKVSREKIPV